MNEKNNSSTAFKSFPTLLLCYLVPLFGLVVLSRILPDPLSFVTLGLFVTIGGTFVLYMLIRSVSEPQIVPVSVTPPPMISEPVDTTPLHNEINALRQSLADQQQKEMDWQTRLNEFNETVNEMSHLKQENEALHKQVQSAVARYRELQENQAEVLQEHQRTIANLREDLALRQQLGDQLEGKVRDLSYEIKTLLRLAEKPLQTEQKNDSVPVATIEEDNDLSETVHTREEAHVQLKRCLDIAQRVTGAGYLTSSPKFQEFALENSALDLRRLSDKLSDIQNIALFVYSPKENKLIYANEMTKQLIGVSVERFIHCIQELIHSDYEPWHNALKQLSFKNDAHVTLPLAVRPSEIVQVECLLGTIQTGLFRNHLVGLIYKS